MLIHPVIGRLMLLLDHTRSARKLGSEGHAQRTQPAGDLLGAYIEEATWATLLHLLQLLFHVIQ